MCALNKVKGMGLSMKKVLFIPNNRKMIKTIVSNGFNSFILPLKDFSIGFDNYYCVKEINALSKKYEVSVIINKFLHKEDLEKIKSTLKNLKNIKGYFVSDLSLLNLLKKEKIIISQDYLITNYNSINMYNKLGYKNIVISNLLTVDEIKEIREKTKSNLFYFGINKNPLLYSKRALITNYNKNFNNINVKKKMKLSESATKHKLDIKEEKDGTIIFNSEVFNFFNEKEKIENYVDYVIINLNNLTKDEIKKVFSKEFFGEDKFLNEKIGYKVKVK